MSNLINKYKKLLILIGFLFLAFSFFVWLFYQKSIKMPAKLAKIAPSKSPKINQNQAVLTQLEKRLVLPTGRPMIFSFFELGALTKQPFFARAKPSDKLIIFQNEKKAILFDPIAQKIVNIGPLFIVPATQEASISTVNNLIDEKSATQSAD